MIRFVGPDEEAVFAENCNKFGIFGTKIYSQYQTYGAQSGIADFWLIWEGDRPIGAVSRLGGTLTLTGTGDAEELAQFLSAVGGETAEMGCPLAEAVNAFLRAPLAVSGILCGQRQTAIPAPDSCGRLGPAAELRTVYNLLCQAQDGFAQAVRYDAWLAEMSHKVRHHLAEVFTLTVENNVISTASILFGDANRAILAGVATDPAFSGRGYGRQTVCYAAERVWEQGRVPFVLIEREALQGFYAHCGFAPCGNWARISLRRTGKE